MGWILTDLLTAQPGSCSGLSSVSSRRHAAAYRHWSSSSGALASASGHSLVLSQVSNQFSTTIKHCRKCFTNAEVSARKQETWHLSQRSCLLLLNIPQGGPVCVMRPSGCVYQLTPAELAHRVSRFGQTAKQHLLPVGVRRLSQLVLWRDRRRDGINSRRQEVINGVWKKPHEEKPAMKFNFSGRRNDAQEAPRLTAVNSLHLPIDGVSDHQGADEELRPPKRMPGEKEYNQGRRDGTQVRQTQSDVDVYDRQERSGGWLIEPVMFVRVCGFTSGVGAPPYPVTHQSLKHSSLTSLKKIHLYEIFCHCNMWFWSITCLHVCPSWRRDPSSVFFSPFIYFPRDKSLTEDVSHCTDL